MKVNITRRLLAAGASLLLGISALPASAQAQSPQAICDGVRPLPPEVREFEAPETVLEPGIDYVAIFCTGAGAVTVDLFENATPETVNNFVFLAQNGYYNLTTFHRVIPDFMAQGGDPSATGSGGPGYQFGDEFVGALYFDRPGLLAMANAGPNTNGSQFFITTAATDWLDYRHTIFGEVVQGYENVEAIEIRDPATATAPGTQLLTVLIVDDPALLDMEFPAQEPASRDIVQNALDEIGSAVGAPLTVNAEVSVISDGADYAATLEEATAAGLTDNGLEYHVGAQVDNSDCQLEQFPIGSFGYALDAFPDAASAAAALDSGAFASLQVANGFTAAEGSDVFTAQTTLCDQPMTTETLSYQVGRFVATATVSFIDDGSFPAGALVSNFARLNFERIFADVLLPELR
ncbi:MAG: peptidylprolyl isomerase [Pleurocapsa minor GSE-CHR-MK-17-07R]|jgi:cyclophilin family peptidyl-prolyl cis-trans isomerase|nr:peptidylprolyl isomerase [Pleurocapsa minor GSE-CHR-MK 17-07R]